MKNSVLSGLAMLAFSLAAFSQAGAADVQATGFVRVQEIDGVWWFISPEGERFVSMGINHVEPHLWLAPYNKAATLKRYGADMVDENGCFNTDGPAAKKWIDQQLVMSRDLNFASSAESVGNV